MLLNKFNRLNFLPPLFLLLLSACGSGGSEPEPPTAYAEKVSNLVVADSVVVFAVEVADTRFELFSVDPLTGDRQGISDTFSANNGLRPVAIAPDQSRVVYRADRNNDGSDELYSNLLDGSDEVLLTDSIATSTVSNSGTVTHFNWQWTPDSSKIIFRSDLDDDGIYEIQSINADGSELLNLSVDLSVRCRAQACWQLSPDGSVLTFLVEAMDQNSQISQSLYRVGLDGADLLMLNQPLSADSRILDWQWSPDGAAIGYISENIGSPKQLYVALPDASQRTLLNPDSISVGVADFAWSPDSSRLAFSDDPAVAGSVSLYNDLPDATNRVQLIDTFNVASPTLGNWRWSPDSARVAYLADQEAQGLTELFTVESDGQWHRKMNGILIENSEILAQWQWSPDGTYIAFYAEQASERALDELYSSAADGSQSTLVNPDLAAGADLVVTNNHWLQNAARIIYRVSTEDTAIQGIYSVLPNGSDTARLTPTLTSGERLVDEYLAAPDSANLLFQIESASGDLRSLHSVAVDGSANADLSTLGIASKAAWLNDSARVIYVVKATENHSEELYSVAADGTGKLRLY